MRIKEGPKLPLPQEVDIYLYSTSKELNDALGQKGIPVSESAKEIIDELEMSCSRKLINPHLVYPKDLGFTCRVPYKDIVSKAEVLGYKPCPAILGPYLALTYPIHRWNYSITIASELIFLDGYGSLFEIIFKRGRIELEAGPCTLNSRLEHKSAFVFIK